MENYICPVCYSADVKIFIEISQIPVYCNILYKSRREALTARLANMELGFCRQCGHVYNYAFDPELMDYTQDYENSLHFSPRFQEYAEALATRLVKRYSLYEKDVIEIGCGDGDFLELICRRGKNRCVGFDPSRVPDFDNAIDKKGIEFVRDYYSEMYAQYRADLICCRHVLEHIQKPRNFLKTVRTAVGQRTDTVIFFEVPNVLYTLKDLGIWDLIYEHCSYFSPFSLRTAFEESGFTLLYETEEFQGQFIGIETKPAQEEADLGVRSDRQNLDELKTRVNEFKKSYNAKVQKWKKELFKMGEKGQTGVVWGAGSKGTTFLNILKGYNQIRYVVDINPRKQGKFIAGTEQQIIAPDFIKDLKPDKIIVMNSIYQDEIREIVNDMGIKAELVVV
jgi:SAM-dependent methyltransferase